MITYDNKDANNKPVLVMFMGLPASGKSSCAEHFVIQRRTEMSVPIIHSSDAIRQELFGDEADQTHNEDVFKVLHRRIKEDLKNGKDVIYDATNISKKRRVAFLNELKSFNCFKVCVVIMTPYEKCCQFNANRERKVPRHAIKKMYLNWNPPSYDEGFDDIVIQLNIETEEDIELYNIEQFFDGKVGANRIDQENSHHSLTIGEHCKATYRYLMKKSDDVPLLVAGLLHDNGKVFTKSQYNSKGEQDGNCHYYQHHCVGAYDSMFYTLLMGLSSKQVLEVANLIYYHMMPYTSWHQSEKAKNRDREQIGEAMFNKVLLLHEADDAAH